MLQGKPYRIAVEPGRYISGNSAVLLTRVLYRKQGGTKNFVIVDAAMNDLVRPTLYDAYHHVWPARPADAADVPPPGVWGRAFEAREAEVVDVVGPVCETGDYLAQARPLPKTARGDLLVIYTAGAYAFAMSSNYNNRPRAAEVLVDGATYRVIRRRETLEDLVALERE
jgi:diaminopimelate decarboxylase